MFTQGISSKRLLRGKSLLSRQQLKECLSCQLCDQIVVDGKECTGCEFNFCAPCIYKWKTNGTYSKLCCETPCRCEAATLKNLNKLKQEYLNLIRFRCINAKCYH